MIKSQPSTEYRKSIERFLEKIVIDAGIGRVSQQPNFEEKILPQLTRDISLVAGQRPQIRRAKKSIAGFKIRQGQVVGLRATLRRRKMVDFFERFITIVLPRVRDFGGVNPEAVDGGGVLNIGVREQFVFPEINPEESHLTFSLGISLVPRHRGRDKALETLERFGVPFKEK